MGERYLDTVEVTGSIPVSPTSKCRQKDRFKQRIWHIVAGAKRFQVLAGGPAPWLAGHRPATSSRHRDLGVIPGNVAAAFTMRMQIPSGLTAKATLTWTLDPPFGFSRSVPAQIGR